MSQNHEDVGDVSAHITCEDLQMFLTKVSYMSSEPPSSPVQTLLVRLHPHRGSLARTHWLQLL